MMDPKNCSQAAATFSGSWPSNQKKVFVSVAKASVNPDLVITYLQKLPSNATFNVGVAPFNASSKAALVSNAANALGYSGYGAYGNAPAFLDGLSRDNPAAWFNLTKTVIAIEPPGKYEHPSCKCTSFRFADTCIHNNERPANVTVLWYPERSS